MSVVVVMLDSVEDIRRFAGPVLYATEWALTIVFTIEYGVRLWCVDRPARYARSFFGIVDLLCILPTYLGIFVAGTQSLIVIRSLRLLRVFRVLRLVQLTTESALLMNAIRASRGKITVFLGAVIVLTVIVGAIMYLIEGPAHGYTSIPRGMYWAIVTMTTVGYGDIHPETSLGQFFAAGLMIMGYGIIAVPTGIVTAELAEASRQFRSQRGCASCGAHPHDADAVHCKYCGGALDAMA